MTKCDEISIVMDIASTNKINAIATKNKNTIAAIVMAATYFSHTCNSDHINIDNHYYLLLLCKTKLIIQNRK